MRWLASGLFEPKVVYGYFPAQADGNDVVVYGRGAAEPESGRTAEGGCPHTRTVALHIPAAARRAPACRSPISLRRRSSGKMDVIGLSLVTIGPKATVETQRLFEGGEYTKYLYLHGLSVETAEALAEFHHKKMREELGIAGGRRRRDSRSVSSEVSRVAVFVWVSGVPEPGGSDEAVCPAEAGGKCGCAADLGVLAGAGAVYFGDCRTSSGSEVLRRVGMLAAVQKHKCASSSSGSKKDAYC